MDFENNSPDILSKALEYEIKKLEGDDDIGDNEDSRLYFQNADISKKKEHGIKFFGKVGEVNGDSRKVFDLENDKPDIFNKTEERRISPEEEDDEVVDEVDSREIFDLIRNIKDPEHPLTLEELHVLEENLITVDTNNNEVDIFYTPTIPHCSMATLIGLSIRVKLLRCLSSRFKVNIKVTPGTHNAEHSVNKQLADKERVAAAIENSHLIKVIDECIYA